MIEKELTNQDGKLKFLGHRYDDNDNKGFLKCPFWPKGQNKNKES